MKTYVTVFFVLLATLAFSQTMWENALAIRQSSNFEWNKSSTTTENNEIIHVWSENNQQIRNVFAMKFDGEGNSLWGEEPIIIADSDNSQAKPQIIATNDECFVVVWEASSSPKSLRAQKIDADGNRLWSDDGVFISDEYNDEWARTIKLLPNDIGGAIVLWRDNQAIVQSLDDNGVSMWNVSENGLHLGYLNYDNQIVSDGHGGLIVIDSEDDSAIVSVKRFSASGDVLWNETINLDEPQVNKQELRIIYNNIDSYYLMLKESNSSNTEIVVRKISLTGQLGTEIAYIPVNEEIFLAYQLNYTTNASGNLFVVCQSMSDWLDTESSLFAFNLDKELNHVWNESGVLLANSYSLCNNVNAIEASNTGELFVTDLEDNEEEISSNNIVDVKLYKVNAEGTVETGESGLLLYEKANIHSKLYLSLKGDLFIAWDDVREGYKELRQIVINDNLENVPPVANQIVRRSLSGFVDYDAYTTYALPNSDRSVIVWLDKRNSMNNRVMYQIVNSDGSLELGEDGAEIADFSDYDDNDFQISQLASAQNDLGQICVLWSYEFGPELWSRIIDSDGSLLGSDFGEEVDPNGNYDIVLNSDISSYNNEFYVSWMVSDILGSTITVYSAKTTNGTEWGDANFVDAFYGTETQFYTYNLIDAISNYTIIEQSENLYEVFKTTDNGTVSESTQVLMGNDYQFDCDADNNLFFTWEQDNKVYAQGITDSNEMYWSSPVDVSSHNEEVIGVAENSNIQISNGINIIWNEVPNDSEIEVRIQKLSYDGNKMWGDDGILLSTMGDCFGENTIEELNEDYLVVGFAEQLDYTNYYKLNLISNESSVLYSENNGLALTGPGVSQYSLDLVSLTDNKLIAVWMQDYQNNRGIYAQMLDFNAVDNYTNETTPMTGILLQNYPNPFNPETNIFFQLPNSGHVRLDVYNIKGQKVKTLVNDRLNAGRHSVVWNGKDESNKQVASGLYLYKISSGKYTNTQKMVLMK